MAQIIDPEMAQNVTYTELNNKETEITCKFTVAEVVGELGEHAYIHYPPCSCKKIHIKLKKSRAVPFRTFLVLAIQT